MLIFDISVVISSLSVISLYVLNTVLNFPSEKCVLFEGSNAMFFNISSSFLTDI